MIAQHVTDSPEALAAIAAPEPKHVWIHGAATIIYTGDDMPPAPAVQEVSRRQIRQALTRAELRDMVEAAVAAGDQDLKDWWEAAGVFERNHPMVIAMGDALGQTDAQLDALFALAATL